MSEKFGVDQEYTHRIRSSPNSLPDHHYSREELLTLSKSPASVRRPKCLEPTYDADDGKWDPEKWYRAKFGLARQASPLTLGDAKEQRKMNDRDFKRRPCTIDPVERLKEERDGIVLSPQRRSFGTGCHVQTAAHLYTRQLSLPEREDSRGDRTRDQDRDKERDRERPVRKIGSGRIQLDRENNRDYSGHFDDRDHSKDNERDNARSRDRDQNWDRDVRDLRDSDRDRRFDRSDRYRRAGERDFSEREWRDREYRERGFDRNSRRRNHNRDEKEPEWFTGGPTSQNDTIELRGFERDMDNGEGEVGKGPGPKSVNKTRVTPSESKSSRGSSEGAFEADVKVFQCSSPDDQVLHNDHDEHQRVLNQKPQEEESSTSTPQHISRASPNNKVFDFEEILNAILPLDENGVRHGSRFSRFFTGPGGNVMGSDTSSFDDLHVPCEGGHSGHGVLSPISMLGPMGAVQHAHFGMHHYQSPEGEQTRAHTYTMPHHLMSRPNSAGDNNATVGIPALTPSVTALFNSAALGGPAVCKWNPQLDCSVETQDSSSLLTNSVISSNSSFSTQDAEAQLKALLFGGHRDSISSSGTASPASLPPGAQRKAKTVAELEADMHQNSPQKSGSSVSLTGDVRNQANSGDVTAFNRLLIMINAASEANQNKMQPELQTTCHAGYGMVPTHNEFNHAVMRNKEKQMQLLHQSLQNVQRPAQPLSGLHQLPHHLLHHMPPPPPHDLQQQPPPPPLSHQQAQAAMYQRYQQYLAVHNSLKTDINQINKPVKSPGPPQAMSTPQANALVKMRTLNGGLVSADPIFNLIQQNPTIVMNPASPAPHMSTILTSQQSAASSARVASPLMFNQQPPLHLSAPSPIHAGQLSPRSITLGTNLPTSAMSSPTGMRSPVLPLSPQELSAHAQAVMQSALIKKQLHDQSERYLKKQQERAKSPSQQQINVVKLAPAAHPVLPPTPQPKGASVNTFTPTSVLRKMHSDKALEKEKHALDANKDEEIEYMPSMHDQPPGGHANQLDCHSHEDVPRKSDTKLMGDLSDISFLDPINPNLVTMTNQLENQLRVGQANVLPGPLSQPMSVEEKMKLSALAEKPGYLSQMLDKAALVAAETARASFGRSAIRAEEPSQEDRILQHHLLAAHQQQQPPAAQHSQSGRPVTGGGPMMQSTLSGPGAAPSFVQFSGTQQAVPSKLVTGRAIIGGSSAHQQQPQVPSTSSAQNIEIKRMLDQHHLHQHHMRHLQQMSHCQGMVLPPPPIGTPIACLGPPPVTVPLSARISMVGQPPHTDHSAALLQQQIARANAATAHRNQQISRLMSMQHSQQHHNLAALPPLHTVMTGVSAAHLSPRSQAAGPLSPAALSATIQRIALPHGAIKMNGPLHPASNINCGGPPKVDLSCGIQRWFSPDILKTQLPSMPVLPAQGSQAITVDELERN